VEIKCTQIALFSIPSVYLLTKLLQAHSDTQTRPKLRHTTLALEQIRQLRQNIISPLQQPQYRKYGNNRCYACREWRHRNQRYDTTHTHTHTL